MKSIASSLRGKRPACDVVGRTVATQINTLSHQALTQNPLPPTISSHQLFSPSANHHLTDINPKKIVISSQVIFRPKPSLLCFERQFPFDATHIWSDSSSQSPPSFSLCFPSEAFDLRSSASLHPKALLPVSSSCWCFLPLLQFIQTLGFSALEDFRLFELPSQGHQGLFIQRFFIHSLRLSLLRKFHLFGIGIHPRYETSIPRLFPIN